MKSIVKRISILLCVCIIAFTFVSCASSKENNIKIRDVVVSEARTSLDSLFVSYEIETNNNVTSLEARKEITREDFESINNLSDVVISENNFIDFEIRYDAYKNVISITASMDNELGYLEPETIYGVAFVNPNGKIDAAFDCDGEMILLSDLGEINAIEECKWLKKVCSTVKSFAQKAVDEVVDTLVDTATIAFEAAPALAAAAVVVTVITAAAPEVIILGEVAVAGSSVAAVAGAAVGIYTAATDVYSDYASAVEGYASDVKDMLHDNVDDVFNVLDKISSGGTGSIQNNNDYAGIVDPEIAGKMGDYGLDKATIEKLVDEFMMSTKQNEYKKTVYLGSGADDYSDVADNNTGIKFGVSKVRWAELVSIYGYDGMWLVNQAFLNYVIAKKWEIVLVSEPDLYYNKFTKQTLVEKSFYAKELRYLNSKGADWHYEGLYWRVDKAW